MRTVRTKIYSFDELSEKAKSKAVETNRHINVDYGWWKLLYEDAAAIGLKITGFDLDRNKHCSGNFELSAVKVAANIISNHGEECSTYKTAVAFLNEHNPIFAEYMDESCEHYESQGHGDKLADIEDEFLKSLLNDYANILQNEYEYLTEDEAIIETIQANEYEFVENGKRWGYSPLAVG